MTVIGKTGTTTVSPAGDVQITLAPLKGDAVWDIVRQHFPAFLNVANKPVADAAKDKNLASCKAAVMTILGPPTVYQLEYPTDVAKRMGAPSNSQILLDAMVAVNAEVKKLREAVLQTEQDALALEQARGVYNHIVDGTAAGTYGEKLRLLRAQGFVTLKTPHRGFISSYEKQPDQFGMSYELAGRLPDGYPRKLVMHVHCTYTGAVRAASIKFKDQEKEKGDGLPLEPASLVHFENLTYTNATVRGLLPFN